MIFDDKQQKMPIFSDEKLSFKRKTLIGLLAVAGIGGIVNGYLQYQDSAKSVQPIPPQVKDLRPQHTRG